MTDLNEKLSEHFIPGEFQCHNGDALPENFAETINDTVEFLERLRFLMNCHIYLVTGNYPDSGIQIVSGHRSPRYNRRIGSSDSSRHVSGQAADVKPAGGYKHFTYRDLCDMAELIDKSFSDRPYRLGRYSHLGKNAFIHVDCGYGHGGLRWGK